MALRDGPFCAYFISMNTHCQFPPSPEAAIEKTQPVSDVLIPALDAACDKAVGIFEHQFGVKDKLDPHLFAHLARFSTKQRLVTAGIAELGYEIAEIPNTGLFMHTAEIEIRVLKARYKFDDESQTFSRAVPNPGTSEARKEYFQQPALMPQVIGGPPILKLVYIWDYDSNYQFICLELACPKRYDVGRNSVDLHWLQPVVSRGRDLAPIIEADAALALDDVSLEERVAVTKAADALSG
jgi:hypothetical protein